jgi:ABC-type enterochelin transport system substrate-binding protein
MTRNEKIAEQIEQAQKVGNTNGMVAVVTENKLNAFTNKTWFGFHFEKPEAVKVGGTYANSDRSLFTVLHIIEN